LRALRTERGLKQYELAKLAKIDQSTVSNLENDKNSNPGMSTIAALEQALQVEPGTLSKTVSALRREGSGTEPGDEKPGTKISTSLPLVGYVGAGEKYYPDPTAGDWVPFAQVTVLQGPATAVRVCGTSMEPRFRDGELLVLSPHRPPIEECVGRDCLIQLSNGFAVLKRVQRVENRYILVSYVAGEPPIEDPDVAWIAPVDAAVLS
jgi:transcriptional regulator with XRE-family HTH domain